MDDVNKDILDLAQNFLDNGGDLPDSSTAKKRFEFQAGLNKIIYSKILELQDDVKLLKQSPSMLYIMRYQTVKFVGALGGFFVFMLALWLALYALVQMPGVREWMHQIIGFPLPPV